MSGNSPHVLFIADQETPPSGGLEAFLARSDFRFQYAATADALQTLDQEKFAAAILVATPPYFRDRQQDLIRLLDGFCERHMGAVLIACTPEDAQTASSLADADGIMTVPTSVNADELAGRVAGLAAAKPLLDSLHRENQLLRKFDHGLNNQITQLDEEMRLAARLQIDFLPRTLPVINGCSFHVLFRPATYVSGDIYDVSRLDEEHIGFYVADAVGHGMPAALLTIFLKRALKTKEILDEGYRIVPPDEALAALNEDMLAQHLSLCQFVTMAYGVLNTRTLELQYARAGHPLPLHLKRGGETSELESEGALLGVFAGEKYPLRQAQLSPGDSVLIYSDGFETAFADPTGSASERYRQELAKLTGPDPAARLRELAASLDQQEGSLHPRDDVTALLLSISADTRR